VIYGGYVSEVMIAVTYWLAHFIICFIIIINDIERLWQWSVKSLFIDATSIVDEAP